MNDKLLSLLGLCRRAGKLAVGFESTVETVKKGNAYVIVIAADTAARTEKEVRFQCNNSVPVIRLEQDKESLSNAIGTAAGTVAVTDEGFARQIMLLHS